jgi:hypothetical protein
MDPITLAVVAALAKVGEEAIKDAYKALKDAIKAKYGAKSGIVKAVDSLEKNPSSEGRKQTLHEEVSSAHADQDAKLLEIAKELMKQSVPGQVTVSQRVTGDRNVFTGTGDITIKND